MLEGRGKLDEVYKRTEKRGVARNLTGGEENQQGIEEGKRVADARPCNGEGEGNQPKRRS